MENTNLSKQQQVSEIMRQMLTQAQTAGQYFTNDQIKEMTRKVSAEVDLVHQQTQNQRYGSSLFFFSSRRRHTRCSRDWSSDVCSSDLGLGLRSFRFLGNPQLARSPRAPLPPAQTRWHRGRSRMADRLPHRQTWQPESLPHEIGRASCRERV